MRKSLLNGSDTAGIFAVNNVFDFFGEYQFLLLNNFAVFYNIYSNIVIYEGQDIKVHHVNIAFHLQNIFFPHFIAACIFDDSHRAVQLVQLR